MLYSSHKTDKFELKVIYNTISLRNWARIELL